PRLIRGEKGRVTPAGLTQAIRPANIHFPAPTLLCLENTHNRAGGTVTSPGDMQAVISVARENGLAVHLDGARVFNAATALGVPVSELVNWCDSVMFCLSKGLGAPVGSMLVGSTGFIQRARKWRKMLGGGMRQAGVIAAAGVIALNSMIDRLKEDHANARFLAEGLAEIKGFSLDLASVQTNMVVVNLAESLGGAQAFLAKLAGMGVMGVDVGPHAIRFVTHKDVGKAEIEQALAIISRSVI
ncbi:MAG TPA: GntG family PLP-dependent aldolase, partial [Verrucomicrobiae bacterium]|nr:GntG family PLP-dependent aldolase [Verrucomicrobiae bacterium]